MAASSDHSRISEPFNDLDVIGHVRRSRRWSAPEPGDRIDARQLLDLLRQHRAFIVLVALAVLALVLTATLLARPEFRSAGRLYLGELSDGERAPARPAEQIDLSGNVSSDVQSEIEIIKSRSLVSRAIVESGLNVELARAGARPVRYWQWRASGRDVALLDGLSEELRAENTRLDSSLAKPVTYAVRFTSDAEYELHRAGALLGRGRLGEPLHVPGLALTLLAGSQRGPAPNSAYELTVAPLEDVTDDVLGQLDVSAPRPSAGAEPVKVVNLRFLYSTPRLAARFLERLMAGYLEQRQSWQTENATAAEEFVTRQLEGMQGSLDEIEKKLAEYRSNNRGVVQDDEGKTFTEQLGRYEEQRVKARLELAALTSIQATLRDPHAPIEAHLLGDAEDTVLQSLATSLSTARQQLTDLEARYNPSAPNVREQRAQVEAQLGSIRGYVSSRLRRAQQNLDSMNGIIGQFEKRLTSVPGAEVGLSQLSRQSEVYARLYSYLLERQQQTAIVKASTISKNRVLDAPAVTQREAAPRLALRLASLPLGLLIGVALVLARSLVNGVVRSESDIRRAAGALPVFVSVPRCRAPRRRGRSLAALAFAADGAVDRGFVEAFRTLRTSLYGSLSIRSGAVVLVSSPCAGDGKTTTALALAASLAAEGRRVLLIDADLRAPTHHALLGGHDDRDLGSVLAGKMRLRDAVWHTELPSGQCALIGASAPLPVELLSSEGLRRMLLEARAAYDHVVIDAPSVPLYSDALVLAGQADCVLSVVRAHHTARDMMAEHLERLYAVSELHAVVINDASPRRHPARRAPAPLHRLPESASPSTSRRTLRLPSGEAPASDRDGAAPAEPAKGH